MIVTVRVGIPARDALSDPIRAGCAERSLAGWAALGDRWLGGGSFVRLGDVHHASCSSSEPSVGGDQGCVE